jgi:pyridoxine 4-dehydrogenase
MRLAQGPAADDRRTGVAVLRRALELGVNHLDTASFYGPDLANQLIREALAPYPSDLVLATKVGAELTPDGRLVPAQHPAELRASVEQNLRTLEIERLDVVNLRRVDAAPGIIAEGEQLVDLDAQLAELSALRDKGKIGAIGLSNVSLEQLQQALPAGIACVQNLYSLLDRDDEALLELCTSVAVAWVPFFPLGGGRRPGARLVTEHPPVKAVAQKLGATPAQVGLAWLLGHAPNVLLIPGTSSVAHLAENVAAAQLPPDQLAQLQMQL